MTNSRPIKLTGHQNKTDEINIDLEQTITEAAKEAKSALAKFVFNPENIEQFKTLFIAKSPMIVVTELNDEKVSRAGVAQLKTLLSYQKTIPLLFELPPHKYFQILFQEKIYSEDLFSLIGHDGILSHFLNQLHAIPDLFQRGRILYYLNHNTEASDVEVLQFLKTTALPESFKELFDGLFLMLYGLAKEPLKNEQGDFLTPETEAFIGTDSPPSSADEARIKSTLRIIKECLTDQYDKILLNLIDQERKNAKTDLAKFVFNPDNREKIKALFTTKPPFLLVKELNEIKEIDSSTLEQLNLITTNQSDYISLFKIPPDKWFQILIQEKTQTEDLLALIGSGDVLEGAVSGILNEIDELKDPLDKARTLHYLIHSAKESDKNINKFLSTLHLAKNKESANSFKASFLQLHHIFHNVRERRRFDDGTTGSRSATEGLLRLKPPLTAEDTARLKAALRIMHECVTDKLNKIVLQLDAEQIEQLQEYQSGLLARQMDEETVVSIDREVNGELSGRSEPSRMGRRLQHRITFPLSEDGTPHVDLGSEENNPQIELMRTMMFIDLLSRQTREIPSTGFSTSLPTPSTIQSEPSAPAAAQIDMKSDYDDNPFEFMDEVVAPSWLSSDVKMSDPAPLQHHSSSTVAMMRSLPSQQQPHSSYVARPYDSKMDNKYQETEDWMIREAVRLSLETNNPSAPLPDVTTAEADPHDPHQLVRKL